MIELSTHIEYLLLCRDHVSVPQLGTFTVKEMSSRRVDEEGIFLPPFRTVTFNYDSTEAGDDFVSSFAQMHGLNRQDAHIVCAEYVDELRQMLEEEGTISFGSMGYMSLDADSGNVTFLPLQSGIASPAYYGLDAVPFARLSHEQRQQRAKRFATNKVRLTSIQADNDTITIRINRRAFNYASAVAASGVLFFALTSPFANSIKEIGKQKAELFLAPKVVAKPEAKVVEAQQAANPEPVATPAAPKDFVIVMASAISEKRAISYAAALQEQGFDAQACMVGKMVRVIIPGFASEDEAYAMIRQSKAQCGDFVGAWPLHIKGNVVKL